MTPREQAAILGDIDKALADFNTAVDKEDVLAGTVYAAVCVGVLERVRDLLAGAQALDAGGWQPAECRHCQQSIPIMRCLKNHRAGDKWCPGSGDNIDALAPPGDHP